MLLKYFCLYFCLYSVYIQCEGFATLTFYLIDFPASKPMKFVMTGVLDSLDREECKVRRERERTKEEGDI